MGLALPSMTDFLRIEGLKVDCIVGVYPHERHAAQPLLLDIEMGLDTRPAAMAERVRATVDYAAVTSELVFLLRSSRFRLIETAAHVIARWLLAPPAPDERRAQLERVRVRLTKPGALRGFAIPSLLIERTREEVVLGHEAKPWGSVDVIHETREAGIYRLNLDPGASIPLHVHRIMRESEMILSDGLFCQGRAVLPGTVHRWPLEAAHGYQNPSETVQSILCVDSPPFLPEDEIPVQGEPAGVPPEPPWGLMGGAR
ncbi:MAG: dihydroneopterin aldolase [Myxococcales bacterium]|nr:dihydroneopterin aldolase [Myxococcales bacterium]